MNNFNNEEVEEEEIKIEENGDSITDKQENNETK